MMLTCRDCFIVYTAKETPVFRGLTDSFSFVYQDFFSMTDTGRHD